MRNYILILALLLCGFTWGNPISNPSSGGTGDLLSTNNLSDVDNATIASRNLGLEIGVDVMAFGAGGGDLLADGTVPLTADWDTGNSTITAKNFVSDVVTGTAPFTVSSTTVVTNLNADTVDGQSASAFEGTLTNSAGLLAALSDETGTGVAVFSTSPTLVTPILGTITSGVGTALTALNGENIQDDTIDDDSIDFVDVTVADFGIDVNILTTTIGASATLTGSNTGDEADANATVAGIVELSTDAELVTGTATNRAVTPANITAFLANDTITVPGDWTFTGALTVGPILGVTKVNAAATYTIGTTSAAEAYGGVIYATGACTLTIPAVATGMNFTVITVGAIAVSVDPNASDLIYLDGTALADGDKATNTSTTGDILSCSYYDATGFYCASGSVSGAHWTDGN